MKRLWRFLTDGIQRKILFVFILAMVIVVVSISVVISIQLGKVHDISADENKKQLASVRDLTYSTTSDLIDKSLGNSTRIEASLADNVFDYLKRHVDQFSKSFLFNQITKEYDPSNVETTLEIYLPEPTPLEGDTVHIQLIPAQGTDLEDSETIIEAMLFLDSIGMDQFLSIRNGFVNSAFIVSPDGLCVIADTDPANKYDSDGNLVMADLTQRDWFKGALDANGVYFSDVHVDIYAKKLGIVCSCAVYDLKGDVIGVVGMDVFLETLARDIEIESDEDSFIFMVNKEGKVVFSPKGTDLFEENPTLVSQDLRDYNYPDLTRFINEAMAGSDGVYTVTIDDESYFMTGSLLRTPQWLLVSAINKDSVESPIREMESEFGSISREASSRFSSEISYSQRTLMTVVIVDVLLCIAFVLVITSRIVKPLGKMSKKISKIKGDDFSFEMNADFKTNDEVEVLAKAFSDLSVRTKDYIKQITSITADKERMRAELDVAAKIQADMLPRKFPPYVDRFEFDLYASMKPAREVGGDFYDFFMVDDDRIALVMADVSGKGVPAALFMAITKSLIKNRTMLGGTPAEILEDVNHQLCEGNEAEFFVTVWLAIINIRTGQGIAVNAGHEHPAIKHKDGSFELVIYNHSPAIAIMDDIKFAEHEFSLQPGDVLFIYTDGVTEATNKKKVLFGTDCMVSVLNGCPNTDPQAIIEAVDSGISDFVADSEQFDDITMLCFRYNGDADMLELEAKSNNLDEVLGFVDGYLEDRDCPIKIQMQIDIAVEEIFVNISHYAYEPNTGRAKIGASFDEKNRIVSFTFIDSGRPFNPLEKKDPDITQKLEERKVGGLGIYMVKKSMDDVKYEYRDGMNILTIFKKI